jgi:hypothetical protein
VWSLSCSGPESLLKKKLNSATTSKWFRVQTPLILDDGTDSGDPEDYIAIRFEKQSLELGDCGVFNSKQFRSDDTLTDQVSAADLVAEIDGLISNAVAGTGCNHVGAAGNFTDYDDSTAEIAQHGISIQKGNRDSGNNPTECIMYLVMHEKVWKFLGYDPEEQAVLDPEYKDPRHIFFRQMVAGADYKNTGDGDVPGTGYWEGFFETLYPGVPFDWANCNLWDGNEIARKYEPIYKGGISILDQDGGQEISLIGARSGEAYIEPQLCWPSKNENVDGGAVGDSTVRYFLFKGKRRVGNEESKDVCQVARCLIRQGTNHGSVHEDANTFQPVMWLERWMDPMAFGLDHPPLEGDWAGSNDESEGAIWAKPLAVFATMPNDVADFAHLVWLKTVLSTGTSTGWSDYADAVVSPVLDPGDNSHDVGGVSVWGDDKEIADLGLGIPHELVAGPVAVADAFSDAAGGWNSDLCRGKWIADGPIQAWDLLRSITEPLRLAWTLHDGKYGLIKWAPPGQGDVDVVLTENDLHEPRDTSHTKLRVSAPIDAVDLKYRYNLEDESLSEELHAHARDPQARGRAGDSIIRIDAPGLIPSKWFQYREDGKTMSMVVAAGPWEADFRQLWEVETATLMARRHFAVSGLKVARVKGQDCHPHGPSPLRRLRPQGGPRQGAGFVARHSRAPYSPYRRLQ